VERLQLVRGRVDRGGEGGVVAAVDLHDQAGGGPEVVDLHQFGTGRPEHLRGRGGVGEEPAAAGALDLPRRGGERVEQERVLARIGDAEVCLQLVEAGVRRRWWAGREHRLGDGDVHDRTGRGPVPEPDTRGGQGERCVVDAGRGVRGGRIGDVPSRVGDG